MKVDSEVVRPILERIAVRGEDDGEKFTNTARVDAIADCLKESGWKLYHDGNLAKVRDAISIPRNRLLLSRRMSTWWQNGVM